jgi:hypothetical protein
MSRELAEFEPGIGQPEGWYLDIFGHIICDVFGHSAYLVGSSLGSRDYRDVDIRVILDDDEFEAMFGTKEFPMAMSAGSAKWRGLCLAFSVLGEKMTGLPIDFQIQPQTRANKLYAGPRNCITISFCCCMPTGKDL